MENFVSATVIIILHDANQNEIFTMFQIKLQNGFKSLIRRAFLANHINLSSLSDRIQDTVLLYLI